jgi:hypothetical protein
MGGSILLAAWWGGTRPARSRVGPESNVKSNRAPPPVFKSEIVPWWAGPVETFRTDPTVTASPFGGRLASGSAAVTLRWGRRGRNSASQGIRKYPSRGLGTRSLLLYSTLVTDGSCAPARMAACLVLHRVGVSSYSSRSALMPASLSRPSTSSSNHFGS